MPGGHDRLVVIGFAGLGDPRSFYLEIWVSHGLVCGAFGVAGVPQQPRLSYLSFPCGRECILEVSRGAHGPECYASCGALWRAVAASCGPYKE